MSEEKSLINVNSELVRQDKDEEAFKAVSESQKFLPRLQLITSGADICKRGEFPANDYAFVKGKDYKNLGKSVDVLVCSWRPKALSTGGDDVIAIHDPANPEFGKIQDRADNEKDSGCMYGPEFLVWVPGEGYATFFLGSTSARKEAPYVKARMHKAATLNSRFIETKKFSWQCVKIVPCTTFEHALPTDFDEVIKTFINPDDSQIETVEKVEGGREV